MNGTRKPDAGLDAELIRLRDVEKMTYGEIAQVIATRTGEFLQYNAIAQRIHRARVRSQTPPRGQTELG
jgi:hypothetical protein